MNYSLEEATPEGVKTGKFVFPRANAQLVAEEVLDTHMGLRGKARSDYMDKNFDRAFKEFDPIGTGRIDAQMMQPMMRYLCGNTMTDL